MNVGAQIYAPEGWGVLAKGTDYHFLQSDARSERVLLVQFEVMKKGSPKANLIILRRKNFEDGVRVGAIVPAEHQSYLPPWLGPLEGSDLSAQDRLHSTAKISKSVRVENRYLHIAPAIQALDSILTAKNPEAEINLWAAKCKPRQNETRFRLWFFTYLCFGMDIWTLLPPFHRSGRWDRTEYPDRKFGAPSLVFGKCYGYGCTLEMIEACCNSYRKRARLGKHLTTIYEEAMNEDFHCKIASLPSGMKTYFHPHGKPFPTYWQFRYRVMQRFGKEVVQKSLYGAARYRNRIAPAKGRFSEEVANLMERVEADGYYTKERPRGYVDGSSLPPICVVTSRDVLSGKKLGIGFSFGAERATAYRMMLFCMAVPKDFFCELFGVTYAKGEWENQGLPGHFAVDRGPGARKNLIQAIEQRFPIRDMAPSWSGQSKATVESSHPRNVKIEGQPSFIQSDLTPVELARREIIELMRYNNGADMSDRIDPDSDLASVTPTPIGLWTYYDQKYRNDAQPMRIDEAIRTFLTPTEFQLREDGVYLQGRRYFARELEESEEFAAYLASQASPTRIQGYVLDMCIRYIWIELNGRLIKLGARLRMRGDEETLWMSLAELDQWDDARRIVKSALRVHQKANASDYKERFREMTGKSWDAGRRKTGKPKRDVSQGHDGVAGTSGKKVA